MRQDHALARRVLDDQLKLVLGQPKLFKKQARSRVRRVRTLAQILGMEERFEKALSRRLMVEDE
jgi:hypothetical protein